MATSEANNTDLDNAGTLLKSADAPRGRIDAAERVFWVDHAG